MGTEATSPTTDRRGHWRRGATPALAAAAIALLALPAWAQDGKKQQGALWLLVVPVVGVWVLTGLQTAALLVFPTFSCRCATAVRRYRLATILTGVAAFAGVLLLSVLVGTVTKNKQAGGALFIVGTFLASLGGVGVSLEIGKWGIARLRGAPPAHPITEVLAGVCLVSWGAMIPLFGAVLWIISSCAALGAFVQAVVRGRGLDEVRTPWAGIEVTPPPVASLPSVPSPPGAVVTAAGLPEVSSAPAPPPARDDSGDDVF